jgi:HemY protein
MIRVTAAIIISLLVALAATWLVTLPGTVDITAFGYRLRPGLGLTLGLLLVIIIVFIALWALVRRLFALPKFVRVHSARRRNERGLQALSDGLIALNAGDAARARTLAREAASRLGDLPGIKLLEANASVALGDWREARRHYRAMIDDPKTSIAALSGLYEQAKAQNRSDAALVFARKAASISPHLEWANNALFRDHTVAGRWAEALELVRAEPAPAREEKQAYRRRQAVLLTAWAHDSETTSPGLALEKAREALKLEANFVPAALIAARIMIDQADARGASSLLRRVWRATGHPHVAQLYANVLPGASALERFRRMRTLIEDPTETEAGATRFAKAAIDALEWGAARKALAGFANPDPTQTTCLLMAEIEEGEKADQGKARQWLARAVTARRDPAWTADGIVAGEWEPVSPLTGELDAFEFVQPPSLPDRLAPATMNDRPGNGAQPAETGNALVPNAPDEAPAEPEDQPENITR